MKCRVSRWKRSGGKRCRRISCGKREYTECISDNWWKEIPVPSTSACTGKCREQTMVVKRKRKRRR